MKRMTLAGPALLALALAAAGCGGAGGEETDSSGRTVITVGVAPSTLSAPLYLAEEQGFFEDEGLKVNLETITSGAEAVPRLLSGDMAFTLSGVAETLEARNNGVELVMAANYAVGPDTEERDYFGIIAKDADITEVEDLEGRTVAVNVLSGGTVAAANAGIEAAGGDPSQINYVEVPSPQQVDAVAKGTVDAAVALEPFVTLGLDQGMHLIQRPQVAGVAGMPSVAVITSAGYAEEHQEVVDAFLAALTEANRYATREISTYTGLDADVLSRINLPMWSDDPAQWDNLEQFVDLLVEQGILTKEPDLDAAIVE